MICCPRPEDLARSVESELDFYIEKGRLKLGDIVVLVGKSLNNSTLATMGRAGKYQLMAVPKGDSVQIESVWRFKGLEKNVVILAEVEDIAANRQSLYVGATRAKLRLSVIGTKPLLKLFA